MRAFEIPSRRAKPIAWAILCVCAAVLGFGITVWPNTSQGFALVFGSGILAYECIRVIGAVGARASAHATARESKTEVKRNGMAEAEKERAA